MSKLKVIELFAGVGGFRLGLEGWKGKSCSSGYKKPFKSSYEVVWSNQWEPSTKKVQHANLVYTSHWGEKNHNGQNIEDVIEKDFDKIPDHDMLVGGFPCQDYSVATSLKNSRGLIGKKGVLWWSIYNIIKGKKKAKPKYLLLENVDRLLVSPANQRGRDFAVMLSCLYEQGYGVEWRVINAADYGMPQRRRRVFIFAFHKSTSLFKKIEKAVKSPDSFIQSKSVLANAFPGDLTSEIFDDSISADYIKVSESFNKNGRTSPFKNAGWMIDGEFYSTKIQPRYNGDMKKLREMLDTEEVSSEFFIDENAQVTEEIHPQINSKPICVKTEWDKWEYLKGPKAEPRFLKGSKAEPGWSIGDHYDYKYAEGQMTFPDDLEAPSRTIITGEGGKAPSRFKHVILDPNKDPEDVTSRYRRLTPTELERLNMFPINHTKHPDVSDTKRAFFMGNALVVGVVEKIGNSLAEYGVV